MMQLIAFMNQPPKSLNFDELGVKQWEIIAEQGYGHSVELGRWENHHGFRRWILEESV